MNNLCEKKRMSLSLENFQVCPSRILSVSEFNKNTHTYAQKIYFILMSKSTYQQSKRDFLNGSRRLNHI